jgi:hypothetical protein
MEGAPLNEADHCGDPPLLLAAGNGARSSRGAARALGSAAHARAREREGALGRPHRCPAGHTACVRLLLEEGANLEQRNVVRGWVTAVAHVAVRGRRRRLGWLGQGVGVASSTGRVATAARPCAAHPPPPQMKETPLIRCAHNGHLHTVRGKGSQGRGPGAGC